VISVLKIIEFIKITNLDADMFHGINKEFIESREAVLRNFFKYVKYVKYSGKHFVFD